MSPIAVYRRIVFSLVDGLLGYVSEFDGSPPIKHFMFATFLPLPPQFEGIGVVSYELGFRDRLETTLFGTYYSKDGLSSFRRQWQRAGGYWLQAEDVVKHHDTLHQLALRYHNKY